MSPLIEFVKNGFSTFSDASRGEYSSNNKEMEALGKDLFKEAGNASAPMTDKKSIYSDIQRVSSDIRKVITSYNL